MNNMVDIAFCSELNTTVQVYMVNSEVLPNPALFMTYDIIVFSGDCYIKGRESNSWIRLEQLQVDSSIGYPAIIHVSHKDAEMAMFRLDTPWDVDRPHTLISEYPTYQKVTLSRIIEEYHRREFVLPEKFTNSLKEEIKEEEWEQILGEA